MICEQPGDQEESDEQDHSSRVHARKAASLDQYLQIHERCDGQPAFDASGPCCPCRTSSRFVMMDEAHELDADPDIEREKRKLECTAQAL